LRKGNPAVILGSIQAIKEIVEKSEEILSGEDDLANRDNKEMPDKNK
jgi:hypothetical protein